MRLILVRHGQSQANASGIVQGRLDFGLSELGALQARLTAERLKDEAVDRILTSPLKRAADTARVIAGIKGMLAEPEPALMEYDIGAASGLTGPEIRERYPEVTSAFAYGRRPTFPGEEGRDAFAARLGALLAAIEPANQTVVAVAHGGVVSALCQLIMGLDLNRPGMFNVANCSLTEIARDRSGRIVLRRHNDTCHLDELATAVDRG